MTNITKDSPFTPGGGGFPPELAGRGAETALLDRMLSRLAGDRVEGKERLVDCPYDPVKVIGCRGVGKTALLHWTKEQAERKGILVVSCDFSEEDADPDPLQRLLAAMGKGPPELLRLLREFGFTEPAAGGGVKIDMDRSAGITYDRIVSEIVQKKPLLLLLEEVHHFDPDPLGRMLQYNQLLLGDAYPLGLVMTGTPGLDGHLYKTKAGFIDRCREIYIHTLSDEATREALRKPFARAGIEVEPDALEAMAEYTDGYPYFIQMVGELVWNRAALAGRRDVDAAFVSQLDSEIRDRRDCIYRKAYDRMKEKGVLPHARRAMQVIDRNGGEVVEDEVYDLVANAKGLSGDRIQEVYDGLREDGFIWTVEDMAKPGLPSFFSYFKSRNRGDGFSKAAAGPFNWLASFIPNSLARGRKRSR